MSRAGGAAVAEFGPPASRRLFFAAWPDAEVLDALAVLQSRHCAQGARRVPAANLHLTLLFIGDCDAACEAALCAAAAGVRLPAFELVLEQLAGVTGRGLLWTAPRTAPHGASELAGSLRSLAAAAGITVQRRPFSAHVTLARRARGWRAASHEPIRWRVRAFSLVASARGPGGAHYEQTQTWPLR